MRSLRALIARGIIEALAVLILLIPTLWLLKKGLRITIQAWSADPSQTLLLLTGLVMVILGLLFILFLIDWSYDRAWWLSISRKVAVIPKSELKRLELKKRWKGGYQRIML